MAKGRIGVRTVIAADGAERVTAARAARGLIRVYQLLVSPVIGPRCRHLPTCSDYAMEAISRFGVVRGGWLAFLRIIRCNPWGTSGYDPVPGNRDIRRQTVKDTNV